MKFTIRDMLWLTVIVALVLGWWVDRRLLLRPGYQAEMLELQLRARGWTVVFLDDGGLILEPPANDRASAIP